MSGVFVRIVRSALLTLPLTARRCLFVLTTHRRLPNLRNPQRFTDKVHWRILNDRRDVLARTCDKLGMKEIARDAGGTSVRIPETVWSGTDLRELGDVALPDRWVLKPTHRFGRIIFGSGRPDIADLQERTAGWLDEINWAVHGEWAYGQAVRQFLVEERIGESEQVPADYKFFVFDGVAQFVLVVADRFNGGGSNAAYYDRDWNRIAVHPGGENMPLHERPDNLTDLLDVAGRIGEAFDFMRVDLYSVDGEVWFGETTPYPVSGMATYSPDDFDFQMGGFWTLPKLG